MEWLDLTLPTPAENLALDEALLDWAEATGRDDGILRMWESDRPFVALGRSSRVAAEVDEAACRAADVPVLRRASGGASVVAGPGCLMYAAVLSHVRQPALRAIDRAHRFVLSRHVDALRPFAADVVAMGISDLAFGAAVQKFSGNSLRIKRTHFLYHGTLLYDLDLSLVARCLRRPQREPDYRNDRPHALFLANLPVARDAIVRAIRGAWHADEPLGGWPAHETRALVRACYASDKWTYCF